MKCLKTMLLVGVSVAALVHASTPTVSLPPFTYVGRVMNSNYALLSELSEDVDLRVRSTNGVLLARTTLATQEKFVENYRLVVPLSSVSTETVVGVNDEIRFELQVGSKLYTSQEMFPNTPPNTPGGIAQCDIMVGTDANKNGIADEYESLMNEQEIPYWQGYFPGIGDTYDPDADYDNDGVNNRNEYLAGTDPFFADDSFRVIRFVQSDKFEGGWELSFFGNRARTYLVNNSDSVTNTATFKQDVFMQKGDETETVRSLINIGKAGAGVQTVILLPTDPDNTFYNVKVK